MGERVLVEFLGEWDSEAVVIGVIRQHPQGTTYNPKNTKRWSTPSGNEVIMNTQGGRDVFQVKTAGKMAFESRIEGGHCPRNWNPASHPGQCYPRYRITCMTTQSSHLPWRKPISCWIPIVS